MLQNKALTRTPTLSPWAAFGILWAGGFLSALGSQLADFAVGVWLFGDTGSVTQYGLLMFVKFVPAIVISPVTGMLVDRFDRRWLYIASDAVTAVLAGCLLVLAQSGLLEPWHLYVIAALRTVLTAIQIPALQSLTKLMLPANQLDRANALEHLVSTSVMVVAPVAGGLVYGSLGLAGSVLIDVVTFGFALVSATALFATSIRPPETPEPSESSGRRSELLSGFQYLKSKPALVAFLIVYALIILARGTIATTYLPLVLTITTPGVLGIVASISVSGGIIGTVLVMARPKARHRVRMILLMAMVMSLALIVAGLRPLIVPITITGFLFALASGVVLSTHITVWQTNVPDHLLGRVLTIRQTVAWAGHIIGVLVSGILADNVFEPLMTTGAGTEGFLAAVFLTGPGRGMGVLITLSGLVMLLITIGALAYRPLRQLDTK